MSAPSKRVEPYHLDAGFERALATMLCSRPKLFAAVGARVEHDCLAAPAAQLAVRAAQAVAIDLGRGPDQAVLVLQRLRRWNREGGVTHEQILAVSDLLDAAEDAGLPAEDAVLGEIAAVVRRRAQRAALEQAADDYAKKGDFARVAKLMEEVSRIGKPDASDGVGGSGSLDVSAFPLIQEVHDLKRWELGVPELDFALGGGTWKGSLTTVIGATGCGKSMFLLHAAATAYLAGRHVALATLELSTPIVLMRLIANVTGIAIDSVMNGGLKAAQDRFVAIGAERVIKGHPVGSLAVRYFSPAVTSVGDVAAWLDEVAQKAGRPVERLCVDMADRMGVPGKKQEESSTYQAMLVVYDGLRNLAIDRGYDAITGSQMRSLGKGQKLADSDSGSDSKHKGRVSDVVITLNKGSATGKPDVAEEEKGLITYNVAKHRLGESDRKVGPIPHDFATGRMCMVSR